MANHEAAHDFLLSLLRYGIRIPEDLSVISVEDSSLIEFWTPSITAVDIQPKLLAKIAFDELLLQRTQQQPVRTDVSTGTIKKVPPLLVDRSSTLPHG